MRTSKRKGNKGEREASVLVQAILYPVADGEVRKTPMSGAWGMHRIMSGDLVCIKGGQIDDKASPFFWEVKNICRNKLSPYGILEGKFGVLGSWWRKARGEAWPDQIPVILWKVDFSSWFVFLSLKDVASLWKLRKFPSGSTFLLSEEASESSVCEPSGFINVTFSTFASWWSELRPLWHQWRQFNEQPKEAGR
jgi:hypothetical protein